MKAALINEYGGMEVLRTINDSPKPQPEAGQVLVEVYAAAVNPFDWKVREGDMKDVIPLQFPAILGGDLAGVVAELGEGVTGFTIGDEVYGQADAVSSHGSYAEFAPVKATSLAPKPKNLDFITAAATPLAGVSAYQALVDHAGLQNGQKVLIHGAAGGIGTFAVPLAKHIGAYVAATAATEDIDYAKELGADEVIDFKTQDFSTILKNFDVVYDTVGGETFVKSHQVLKKGGIIVTMAAQPDPALAEEHGVTQIAQYSKVNPERLAKLSELLEQGILKVNVDKVYPLDEASEALAYLHSGQHRGKVVLKVK